MMNREKFMTKLNIELSFLPLDEKENALRFYEEYFDEAGVDNEQNVIRELGSAKNIAKKILKETKDSDYKNFEDDILKNNNYKYIDVKNYKEEIENITAQPIKPTESELLLTAYTPEEAKKYAESEMNNIDKTQCQQEQKESKEPKEQKEQIHSSTKQTENTKENERERECVSNRRERKSMSTTAKVLIICSLPITIPIVIAFAALALGIFITVISAIFSIAVGFVSVMIAMLATGFALLIAGAGILAAAVSNIFTGGLIFFPIALALILISGGIILTYFSLTLSINIIKWIFKKFLTGSFKMLGKMCSGIFKKVVRW